MNHCLKSNLLILATLRRFVLGTIKKQTIPASRASRLVHPQTMGTILIPHSNISYRGPCIAICIVWLKSLGIVAALLSGSLSNHSLRASSPGGRMLANFSGLKGTGSRLSACLLIKLVFSNLLLILSVNNPAHMYLNDLRVYFKVEVYLRVTWSRMKKYYNRRKN